VSQAHEAFDGAGALNDAKLAARLDKIVTEFVRTARAIVESRKA
jgi:hypothetical protein